MPITFEVHAQDPIVIVSLDGKLRVEDYADCVRVALADPRQRPGSALLLDAGRLDPLPSVDDLRALVGVAREVSARGVEPFAIVVRNDLQYLAGRLFSTFANAALNLESRVFRTKDVALQWLQTTLLSRTVDRPVSRSDADSTALAP